MFAEKGVGGTTVRQIGARAGVLSGSLYHHFGSKLDIVNAILEDFSKRMMSEYHEIAQRSDPPLERLTALINHGLSLIASDAEAVRIFQRESASLATRPEFAYLVTTDEETEAIYTRVMREGIESGTLRADLDPHTFYRVIRDTTAGFGRWFDPNRSRRIEELAADITDLLVHGAASTPVDE